MRSFAYTFLVFLAVSGAAAAGASEAKKAVKPASNAAPVAAVPAPAPGMKRFMVLRTFPAGAIDGLDAVGKKQVNEVNASHWEYGPPVEDEEQRMAMHSTRACTGRRQALGEGGGRCAAVDRTRGWEGDSRAGQASAIAAMDTLSAEILTGSFAPWRAGGLAALGVNTIWRGILSPSRRP